MKSVLIINTHHRTEEGLKQEASRLGVEMKFRFDTTASFGQEDTWWVSDGPDVLIIILPDDEELAGFFLKKMVKDLPKYLPIILIAKDFSSEFIKLSAKFRKLRLLKGSVSNADLLQAILQLTTDRPPNERQRHQRYDVQEKAKVTREDTAEILDMEVKNLSLGGAYLEFFVATSPINIGEELSIDIESGEKGRAYSFKAEVVWCREIDNGFGLGVKFIHGTQQIEDAVKKDEEGSDG